VQKIKREFWIFDYGSCFIGFRLDKNTKKKDRHTAGRPLFLLSFWAKANF
jgi:hypothetical protein